MSSVASPGCSSEPLHVGVLGKILQAVNMGTVGDFITVPTPFALGPGNHLFPALGRVSSIMALSIGFLMITVHVVLKIAFTPC